MSSDILPSVHLLWISTKPPWPPIDGGRLAQALTLEALARAGVRITLVAPAVGRAGAPPEDVADRIRLELVEVGLHSFPRAFAASLLKREPVALLRHRLPAVRDRVAAVLDHRDVDAVHVEQLHAWAQSAPARRRGIPCLLRAQNVESDLWRAVGERGGLRGLPARREARLLARAEGRAVSESTRTVALTSDDARRLTELADGKPVEVVPPPFPATLPHANDTLPGDPPLVLLGSGGWWPNRDAEIWCTEEIWPRVARRVPGAILHRFGDRFAAAGSEASSGGRIVDHEPPPDSRRAFAPHAILLVPLRIASGIRMKVLEAWARGVPVVATSRAAAGLEAEDGRELLLADDAESFSEAVERLAESPELRRRVVDGGRRALEARHDASRIARGLRDLY